MAPRIRKVSELKKAVKTLTERARRIAKKKGVTRRVTIRKGVVTSKDKPTKIGR